MKITVINTGGTFNKKYNPLSGELEVSKDCNSLDDILKYTYNIEFEILTIISKDSLEINNSDRKKIVGSIKESRNSNIIVIHGTDTIDLTASFIDEHIKDKKVVLTAAMIPISIEKIEATLNFAQALGFLNANVENGVYISMHGSVRDYRFLKKNRELGQFLNS